MLSVRGLSARQGDVEILAGLDFELAPGSLTALLGANGAGKSTLLRRLLGQLQGSGSCLLGGRELSGLGRRERARLLTWVPQSPEPLPFTVEEFLRLARHPWDDGHQEAVDAAIAALDLGDKRLRRLDQLSGGERQRAYIAAALAQDCPLILLDEAASGLDPAASARTWELALSLTRRQGKTLLWATHDLNEALECADAILALRLGRIAFAGSPGAFVDSSAPEHVYDRKFRRLADADAGRILLL
ncbi:MAG: hypothetical protein RL095_3116 [Verrucomicrobiota bacterium]|jgi:iron complex transport system ATP-binding protein